MVLSNAERQKAFRTRRDAQANAWEKVTNPESRLLFRAHLAQCEAEQPGTATAVLRFKEEYITSLSSKSDIAPDDPRILLAQAEAQAARDCEGARFAPIKPINTKQIRQIRLKSGEVIVAPR